MRFLLMTVCLITVGHAVRYRIVGENNLEDCPNSPPHEKLTTYADTSQLEINKIDDDTMEVGGQIKFVKSLPLSVLELTVISQYRERGSWVDGPMNTVLYDLCAEFHKPERPWYNRTYRVGVDQCPPKAGTVIEVDYQTFGLVFETTSKVSTGDWRVFGTIVDLPRKMSKFCVTMAASETEIIFLRDESHVGARESCLEYSALGRPPAP